MSHIRRTLCAGLLLLLLLLSGSDAADVRTWTDRTGKFKVEAEFIELVKGKVTLKRADSEKTVVLPLSRLSKEDQSYVREAMAERRQQAAQGEVSNDTAATDESTAAAAETQAEPAAAAADAPAASPPTPRVALPARRPPSNVINSVRGAVYRTQTLNNMKQIALALQSYESTHSRFPASAIYTPDGKPGLSWRVAILPMIEEDSLYRQFHLNEPWDSPHNRELVSQMPQVFQSPGSDLDEGYTNYLAIVGPDSLISSDRKGVGMRQVRDGTSLTLAIVEADDAYASIWTKPDDYTVDTAEPAYGLGGIWSGMFFGAMGDGSVKSIPLSITAETLNGMFTRGGGEPISLP